jgi:hypothetical protein
VRATASAALLQFLLDYPLSPSRLQGHMVFLLTNTGYKHEEGRLQALDMLQQVRSQVMHSLYISEAHDVVFYMMQCAA